jgi:S-DNA-T family DNA segregation ATPase FtsK/SpoIIIE
MRKQRIASQSRFGFLSWFQTLRLNLGSYIAEAFGLMLLAGSLLTLLGLVGITEGNLLNPWINLLRRWLGWGAILIVLTLASAGWRLLISRRTPYGFAWGRVVAEEIAAFSALGLLSLFLGQSLETAETGDAGGLIGWGIVESLSLLFGSFLPNWLALGIAGFILIAIFSIAVLSSLRQTAWLHVAKSTTLSAPMPSPEPVLSISPVEEKLAPQEMNESKTRSSRIPAEFRKDFRIDEKPQKLAKAIRRSADLPPLGLLVEEQSSRPDERHINQMAGLLEKTLAEFGIPARVVGFQVGPTVTQFHLEPGYIEKAGEEENENRQKVRVAQISALQRDLALALSAQRLRIQAPVPGRSYVGIEVPNSRTSLVRLRPVLESQPFQKLASPLGMALGRDVSGTPIAADLAKMPHLLVAGTTGSGKSVLISAIAICLVMNNSPENLRLIMLDPKMVELVRFNGLPHLLGKVETNLNASTRSCAGSSLKCSGAINYWKP